MKFPRIHRNEWGFTLVELLVAVALMTVVMLLIVNLVGAVSRVWSDANTRVTSYQAARAGFDRMGRAIAQASLNPYWDYLDASSNRRTPANLNSFRPTRYGRVSDQHFLVSTNVSGQSIFFQAPLGYSTNYSAELARLDNMLNAVGFFVEFNSDEATATKSAKPSFLSGAPRWRYRLMELLEPAELLQVYQSSGRNWILADPSASRSARPIAENVILLLVQAQDARGNPLPPGTTTYIYDSRNSQFPASWNQLPPRVRLTIVVIDEASAARLALLNGTSPPALVKPTYFQNPARFSEDLKDLQDDLLDHPSKINFRVFDTAVRIEAAKWSE